MARLQPGCEYLLASYIQKSRPDLSRADALDASYHLLGRVITWCRIALRA